MRLRKRGRRDYLNGALHRVSKGNRRIHAERGNGFSGAMPCRDMIFDRILPHDDDAEMAAAGGMRDERGRHRRSLPVTIDAAWDFTSCATRNTHEAITCARRLQPVDVVLQPTSY